MRLEIYQPSTGIYLDGRCMGVRMMDSEITILHEEAPFSFPAALHLASKIEHLGAISARNYASYKVGLFRNFEDNLPRIVAFSNALYQLAIYETRAMFSSEFQVSFDDMDFMQEEDETIFSRLDRDQLLRAFSIDIWPGYLPVLFSLACLFLEKADGLASREGNTPEIVNLVCEATRAVEISKKYGLYERGVIMGLENAKNDPDVIQAISSERGRQAVEARYAKPDGTYDRQAKIRARWASGKYASRDICAEEEYASLEFGSFKSARNALKGTQDPIPWPGKKN